jgi:hypothetical protein
MGRHTICMGVCLDSADSGGFVDTGHNEQGR